MIQVYCKLSSSSDHVNNDKKSGKSRTYKIVFVPKKVCDEIYIHVIFSLLKFT